ncbi:ATP-binding cassette domain-containing protein [Bacillus sp. FJAT-27231]|uniref:ATP-binding cassette domain-containing protein n=1 Tax=Bacillus sp. FJAT-27231 TaxID=1679168 RepID=UPI00069FE25B|nr:ATP-binding cassette domain-containing protein [Bacillus sp. FJAT-27231]
MKDIQKLISILGPSGCGKPALLRIVAGLEEQTEGHIYLDENEISGPSSNRGMVFQAYSLFPWLTVEENIQFELKIVKCPPPSVKRLFKIISN